MHKIDRFWLSFISSRVHRQRQP